MLIFGFKPGHDGAIAVIRDRNLVVSLEGEKDGFPRHAPLTPMTMLAAMERAGDVPDVIAIGGWIKELQAIGGYSEDPLHRGNQRIETAYRGARVVTERETEFLGKRVKRFSSSHVRSHIMMGAGMAPPDDARLRAVLVMEGAEGSFYLLDERWQLAREIPTLEFPGGRYSLAFAIADSRYWDHAVGPEGDEAGKLMALAAFGDPADADDDVRRTVERLVAPDGYPTQKGAFKDTPLYNAGVESEVAKTTAALLTDRMFDVFAEVALRELPKGIPLYISGGCGLNCEWNMRWRELGHFSSVFVPPCTNDSGSALGTALDALAYETGDPRVEWSVYCGLDFEWDQEPSSGQWQRRQLEEAELADAIAAGHVVAWVQGRYEMGPRALGNRSLLAEPFRPGTKDRLNEIKMREDYRPIAPCCRIEDVGKVYDATFHDPYMLYFRHATTPDLRAVTHVDGSARVQTVTKEENAPLHALLTAFSERHGVGVLCNTSLNFKQRGFINRMSDLIIYCDARGIDDMVVGDLWFQRVPVVDAPGEPLGTAAAASG
jgi:hydroxymethyl cephem carbamoyltransferase